MPYELTKLLKETIKIEIDKKITGKATVNIINDLLIVDIIPRNLNDSIFRCTLIILILTFNMVLRQQIM